MKITIDNYEAYILDRIEGNLSAEGQKELDAFLVSHPELQDVASQYDPSLRLLPDMDEVFADKESLKRYEPTAISYKHWFSSHKLGIISAAACVAVLFGAAIWLFNQPKADLTIAETPLPVVKEDNVITKEASAPSIAAMPRVKKAKSNVKTPQINSKDSIIKSDKLVIYMSDKLVKYEISTTKLVLYHSDKLVVYDTATKSDLNIFKPDDRRMIVENISLRLDTLQEKLLAYVPKPIKNLFNN
ncbi:MAG: hypothetical protein LBL74_02860 [Bacteroidales bacterium]|jgi:hypothetical protein|nr:hypothetical protein [Bacteroidales bacterium]